ncbi:MAG TPA: UvrD-helicase domain-containing protein, partial [Lentisphaeria bacterium]|nr:UvrD-helicase domain-containing protein [Lentisphaeria bacterium]
ISTIHGFCHRMLNENAFESGIRYGLEARADISAVINDIIHDFARSLLYPASTLRVRICNILDINPDTLLRAIRPATKDIGATIDWGLTPKELDNPQQALANLEEVIDDLLKTIKKDEPWQHFPVIPDNLLNKDAVATLSSSGRAAFQELLKRDTPMTEKQFRAYTTEALVTGINKTKGKVLTEKIAAGDARAFTAPFDALAEALPRYRRLVHFQAIQYFHAELATRKLRDNFLTFNDMLTKLDDRLQSEDGERLAEVIRAKYDCALVDEFQDTDPIQYNIFNRIFKDSDRRAFFMIGDPKQAIYSFRGGDIFAYLQACQNVPTERRFTLATNYRSSDAYIDALNDFYKGDTTQPFAHEGIIFTPIIKPPGNCKIFARAGQIFDNPLTICTFDNKDLAAKNIVAKIAAIVADPELTITLDGVTRRPRYSDMAVLVRTSKDGDDIEKQLVDLRVPVIWTHAGNIFLTAEANELLDLMTAVTQYNDSRAITKVLASRLFAASADDLLALRDHMPDIQLYFERLYELWSKKSFLTMFRTFLEQPHAHCRSWLVKVNQAAFPATDSLAQLLAKQPSGARTLTNFIHLGEKLHQAATQRRLGPEGLITFLKSRSRNSSETVADSDQDEDDETLALRMATQQDAVLIMTLHKSKGLQFPFVFLPHLPAVKPDERDILFHDENGKRCLDLTPSRIHRDASEREALQETLRILYVGLTRAIFACHIAYSHRASRLSPHNYLKSRLEPWITEPSALPEAQVPPQLIPSQLFPAQIFTERDAGKLEPGWQTCSFTSLAHTALTSPIQLGDDASQSYQEGDDSDLLDDEGEEDDGVELVDPVARPTTASFIPFADREPIFQLRAGKRAGLLWHSIFEKLNFQSSDNELEAELTAQLGLYSLLSGQPECRECQRQAFITMTKGILGNTLPGNFRLA